MTSIGSRYNESKLVKQLETLGIGRPSTYSKTIQNIQDKYYVEKKNIEGQKINVTNIILENNNINEIVKEEEFNGEKNKLVITDLGIKITEFLKTHFELIMNYDFTAEIEKDLDKISHNEKIWYKVVDYYYKKLEPEIKILKNQIKNEKKEKSNIDDNLIGEYKNKNFYRFESRYGPRITYGKPGEKDTIYMNLKKNKSLENHNLDDAISLLPRILGKYKNEDIKVMEAKSVYFKVGKNNFPLHYKIKKKEKKDITLEDALDSIKIYLEKKNKKI
jgi:DNA topoisomerase-1